MGLNQAGTIALFGATSSSKYVSLLQSAADEKLSGSSADVDPPKQVS